MITSTTLNPKLIFIQASTPSDVTEGKLWYNTSNNKTYVSNGTAYNLIADVEQEQLIKTALENSLDILEIQAADTLEGGQSANMIRDIFSDADGYLNTIDTDDTTATFQTATTKYTNIGVGTEENHLNNTTHTLVNTLNFNATAVNDGIISYIVIYSEGGSTDTIYKFKIVQNGVTLLDKNSGVITANNITTTTFTLADYSDIIKSSVASGVFNIEITRVSGDRNIGKSNQNESLSGTNFNLTNVQNNFYWGNKIGYKPATFTDKIIQTAKQDLSSTPTKFQIFGWKTTTSESGTINAEISFDNGANYQTANLNEETSIKDTGDEMILKINLNAGASSGTAELKGYGVMFW